MSVVIYHNPRCSKSRQTLELLEQHGVTPEVVKYLETPLNVEQLKPFTLNWASPLSVT